MEKDVHGISIGQVIDCAANRAPRLAIQSYATDSKLEIGTKVERDRSKEYSEVSQTRPSRPTSLLNPKRRSNEGIRRTIPIEIPIIEESRSRVFFHKAIRRGTDHSGKKRSPAE